MGLDRIKGWTFLSSRARRRIETLRPNEEGIVRWFVKPQEKRKKKLRNE